MHLARKRPLPAYPEVIGIVTSPVGAAVHDVLRTLRRRYPLLHAFFLAGVIVEGDRAAKNIVEGMRQVVVAGAEVVLVVRGGGSYESMMPYNDELLGATIARCPVPVVTGIGHEPDNFIADMVADVRCSTPTGAAETVAPSLDEVDLALIRLPRRYPHLSRGRPGRCARVWIFSTAPCPRLKRACYRAITSSSIVVRCCRRFESRSAFSTPRRARSTISPSV